MNKYLIPFVLTAAALTSGCQSLAIDGQHDNTRYALYPGNELRDQWYTSYHTLTASNGTEFRGYRSSFRRHWFP